MSRRQALRDNFGYLRGNVLVISITDLLGNFSRRMIFPYASLYILALGGSPTQIGLINSVGPLLGLVIFPLSGHLADQAGRVRLIVLGNLFSVIFVLMYVIAPNWELIAIATALRGLLVIQFPAKSALVADSLSPGERGRGIAAMNLISNALAIFAPFLAGTVVDAYGTLHGLRALYVVMLLLYLSNGIIHLRFLKETSTPSGERFPMRQLPGLVKETYQGVPDMLRRFPRSLRALTVVVILNFMCNGVASPFWVVYAIEEIGLSPTTWGLILLIEMVVRWLMFIPAGLIVDRWGRSRTLVAALALSLFSIPFTMFARGFTPVLLIRLAVAVAYATAIPATTALMADIVPRRLRGRVMAAIGQGSIMIGPAGGGTGGPAMGFLVTVPLMLSSLAGGFMYAANPDAPWIFVGVATLVSIGLTLAFVRDPQSAEV
jgi:MFS family permease